MERAGRPNLAAQAALNILDRLELAVQNLTQQRDVGDGQPQGVDLGQPLLVGEGRHVSAQLLEGRVDAGAIADAWLLAAAAADNRDDTAASCGRAGSGTGDGGGGGVDAAAACAADSRRVNT